MDAQMIPMDKLGLCLIQLRPVCKETLEYLELRDSIRECGVLQSLLVRPKGDLYEVVLGFHRWSIAKDERISEVPCGIRNVDDAEVHRLQVVENALRIETSPVQYARRLWRIIEVERAMTLPELAHSLHKNVDWTRRMLNLVRLCPEAEEQLAANQVPLSLAVELAKLPHDDQRDLLRVTGGVPNREAIELARQKARHFRQNSKNHRVAQRLRDTYELQPIYIGNRRVIDELECPTMMASVFEASNAQTDGDKWKACLSFVLQLDPETRQNRLRKIQQTGD